MKAINYSQPGNNFSKEQFKTYEQVQPASQQTVSVNNYISKYLPPLMLVCSTCSPRRRRSPSPRRAPRRSTPPTRASTPPSARTRSSSRTTPNSSTSSPSRRNSASSRRTSPPSPTTSATRGRSSPPRIAITTSRKKSCKNSRARKKEKKYLVTSRWAAKGRTAPTFARVRRGSPLRRDS